MRTRQAIAEDFRRFGIILLAAAVVGGFLQEQVAIGAAAYAAVSGIACNIVGYWLHRPEV